MTAHAPPPTARIRQAERLFNALGPDGLNALYVTCSPGASEVASWCVTALALPLIPTSEDPAYPPAAMPRPGTSDFVHWLAAAPLFPDARVAEARVVVLVDDGLLATPALVSLAAGLRARGALRLVVAAPWLSPTARSGLELVADRVVSWSRVRVAYEEAPHPAMIQLHKGLKPPPGDPAPVWS